MYVLIQLFSNLQIFFHDSVKHRYNLPSLSRYIPYNYPELKPLSQLMGLLKDFGNYVDYRFKEVEKIDPNFEKLKHFFRQKEKNKLLIFNSSNSSTQTILPTEEPTPTKLFQSFTRHISQNGHAGQFIHIIDLILSHYTFHPSTIKHLPEGIHISHKTPEEVIGHYDDGLICTCGDGDLDGENQCQLLQYEKFVLDYYEKKCQKKEANFGRKKDAKQNGFNYNQNEPYNDEMYNNDSMIDEERVENVWLYDRLTEGLKNESKKMSNFGNSEPNDTIFEQNNIDLKIIKSLKQIERKIEKKSRNNIKDEDYMNDDSPTGSNTEVIPYHSLQVHYNQIKNDFEDKKNNFDDNNFDNNFKKMSKKLKIKLKFFLNIQKITQKYQHIYFNDVNNAKLKDLHKNDLKSNELKLLLVGLKAEE
jgi:hypothetical protein